MIPPTRRSALAMLAAALATPTFADHPGDDLDARMMDREKYFQIINTPSAPAFELQDAEGNTVQLSDYSDKVIILNFIFASCVDICPLHTQKIAEIQAAINDTPMKDMVQFISITTDPVNDTDDVMSDYAALHGLDPANWILLTKTPEQPDDAIRLLAKDYGLEFTMTGDSDVMMHAAVTHVIDTGGRFAAKFHGMNFSDVNLILYVNGLINNAHH